MNRLSNKRKNNRLFAAMCLVAGLLVSSCQQDETTNGNELPEGRYLLAFTATQGDATPQTRVSENADGISSTWTDGDQIGVQIAGNAATGVYTLNADGTIKTVNTPVYWQSTANATVTGWYPATNGTVDLSYQNAGLKYVLKAEQAGVAYNTTPTLTFKHQLAKVQVKLTGAEASSVTNVKINSYTTCTNTQGTVTTSSASVGDITMYKAADKTWEANVVPGYTITKLKVNDTDCTLEGSGVAPVAGQWHEVIITVKDPLTGEIKLSDYSDGATLRVAGTATIKGNSQSKDLKIIIKNGAQVTLDNVILNASTTGNVITCQNNATITLVGSNNITGYGDKQVVTSSAILVEGGTLTIGGTGSLNAKGNGTYSCGIGAINSASIVINDGSITAIGGTLDPTWGCPGIGPVPYQKDCGDITINGGTINATGGPSAAGIGSNLYSSCGNILITGENTTVNAKGGNPRDHNTPADIGAGVYGTCGSVTFTDGATVNGQRYN